MTCTPLPKCSTQPTNSRVSAARIDMAKRPSCRSVVFWLGCHWRPLTQALVGFVEQQFNVNRRPAHDDQGVFYIGVQVEIERHLAGAIGRRQGPNAVHRKHTDLLAQVTVPDQIQSAVGIPQVVGIDLAPPGSVPRGRVVAHLHGARPSNRPVELVYGLPMLTVGLVGT